MADSSINLYGKPLKDYRVIDLKKELEKRSLSKSGSKSELIKRLKAVKTLKIHDLMIFTYLLV